MPEHIASVDPATLDRVDDDLESHGDGQKCDTALACIFVVLPVMLLLAADHKPHREWWILLTLITFSSLLFGGGCLLRRLFLKATLRDIRDAKQHNSDAWSRGEKSYEQYHRIFVSFCEREWRLQEHLWRCTEIGIDMTFMGLAFFGGWALIYVLLVLA